MALRRTFRVTLALLPLAGAAACVSKPAADPAAVTDMTAPQPRTATYACGDGGRMTIENLGTSVRLLRSDGTATELPASPANQNSRYGEAHDAVVLDGREALVMQGGATPLTCTR